MSKNFKVGIDYGGTKIEGILMDNEGNEILRKRSTYEKNYESGIDTVKSLIEEFDRHTNSVNTVGVCIPGFSSKETGLVNNANCVWINDRPFHKDLERSLNRDIKLMNDANCFALSEAIDGSGANYQSVWGIIIGSGFGGSFVYKKQVIEGINQVAGDWGHQPLPYPTKEEYELNPKCEVGNCGRPLCAEQFISGIGFTKIFNSKYGTNFRTREIVALEANGDERAKKEFELYEDRFARLISVMIGIIDPDVIVIGGGMSNVERIYENIPKLLPKYTFSDKIRNKILRNTHGDSSGVRGAAWLWDSDKF
jgi:fructokinase